MPCPRLSLLGCELYVQRRLKDPDSYRRLNSWSDFKSTSRSDLQRHQQLRWSSPEHLQMQLMKRFLIPFLALSVTACGGLSEEEIAAYQEEINRAESKALENTRIPTLDSAKKWRRYKNCLTEYQEIYEALPKAKTQCKQRAVVDL